MHGFASHFVTIIFPHFIRFFLFSFGITVVAFYFPDKKLTDCCAIPKPAFLAFHRQEDPLAPYPLTRLQAQQRAAKSNRNLEKLSERERRAIKRREAKVRICGDNIRDSEVGERERESMWMFLCLYFCWV